MSSAERAMWGEVLMRGMADATASLTARMCQSELQARREARLWIGTQAFRDVCELAGLDPAAVLGKFRAGEVGMKRGRYVGQSRPDRYRTGDAVRKVPMCAPAPWEVAQ
jgi:hypothetical protein